MTKCLCSKRLGIRSTPRRKSRREEENTEPWRVCLYVLTFRSILRSADLRLQGHTENITVIEDTSATKIIEQYRRSVQLAKEAGFDGVELLAQG